MGDVKGLDWDEIRGGEGLLGDVVAKTLGNETFIRGDVGKVLVGLDATFKVLDVVVDTGPGDSWTVVEFVGFWRTTSSFATLAGNDT